MDPSINTQKGIDAFTPVMASAYVQPEGNNQLAIPALPNDVTIQGILPGLILSPNRFTCSQPLGPTLKAVACSSQAGLAAVAKINSAWTQEHQKLQAEKQLLKSKAFKTAREAADFIIEQGFSVADLGGFKDISEEILADLFKNNSKINHLLVNNSNVSKLPAECSRLHTLDCSYCLALKQLPDGLSSLTELNCESCTALTQLPDGMSRLIRLHCESCTALTHLPDGLSSLTWLECFCCTALTHLPDGLSSLTKLDCPLCPLLKQLPDGLPHYCDISGFKGPIAIREKTVGSRADAVDSKEKETTECTIS